MEILAEKIVTAKNTSSKTIDFSPLDLFVMGHSLHGPVLGFDKSIDFSRFVNCVEIALRANPEMGSTIDIDARGHHRLRTGAGIPVTLQRASGPMPSSHAIGTLPLSEFPLAHPPMAPEDVVKNSLPLLAFRITMFDDERCILGIRTTHSHIDGCSLTQFIVNLGEIYNGGEAVEGKTGRDRIADLGQGDGSNPSTALHLMKIEEVAAPQEESESTLKSAHSQIVLDRELFETYVDKAKYERPGITTSDIVCALAWKSWALASPINQGSFRLYSVFNLRQLDELGIGMNYQGNAVIDRCAELNRTQLHSYSIADIALRYRQQIKPLKASEVAQDIAFIARQFKERAYGQNGLYKGFVRRFLIDMMSGQGIAVNDLRLLPLHRIKFESKALWYESGQNLDGVRNYIEVTRRSDGNTVFHCHSLAEEADRFEWELRKLIASSYIYC